MEATYRVLTADPPWLFGDKLPGKTRGASKQYRCLTVAEIKAWQLPPLEADAILFLWRVAAMQEEALSVVRAWGFVPKAEMVWEKLTKTGKPWMGMGHYVRASHETAIIATRGRFHVRDRSIRSRFSARVPVDDNGRYIHSAKPEDFRELVEAMSAGPYVELFGRKWREGWTVLGDEVGE